ncbi:ethanolamine kinase 1 isoform X3 [Paramisgurnus dabryanus]|uniref:ethanolamine kinase 1 isoform X3 n=1 Tax=Paramisgurnus dabryanus TaxID=90735 RepID=UPI003CCFB48F
MEIVKSNASDAILHLDVCVDKLSPRPGITELLKKLRPQWKPEDIQIKAFTEGITNQLMGCYVGSLTEDPVVLVRVFGQMTELFLDREKEKEMFRVLHKYGCGPRLYCSFTNGICYEFVRGVVLDDILLKRPSVYRFSVHLEAPNIKIIIKEIEELKSHLNHIDSPVVLCHNDLLTKNIIYNPEEGTVKFIDYEYADFNYQAYDIGNHFNEFAGINNVDTSLYPSCELQFDWLTAYLESFKRCSGMESSVTKKEVKELYIKVCKFSLVAHFFWCLWALLQAKHSTIDFDFQRDQLWLRLPLGQHNIRLREIIYSRWTLLLSILKICYG